MRKRTIGLLFMLVLCLGLLPRVALAQGFSPTPDATLDRNGVLHWDAEGGVLQSNRPR